MTEVGTLLLEAIPLAPRFDGERWWRVLEIDDESLQRALTQVWSSLKSLNLGGEGRP